MMNKLKTLAFMVLAFISFTELQAQIIAQKADSTEKATIRNLEKETKEIAHDGINYYFVDGIWYTKFKNKLVLRQPPKGLKINFLPKDGKLVTMGGKKYYKHNGVFYKKIKGGFYEVARP